MVKTIWFEPGSIIVNKGYREKDLIKVIEGYCYLDNNSQISQEPIQQAVFGPSKIINLLQFKTKSPALKQIRALTKCLLSYTNQVQKIQLLEQKNLEGPHKEKKQLLLKQYFSQQLLTEQLAQYVYVDSLKFKQRITLKNNTLCLLIGEFILHTNYYRQKQKINQQIPFRVLSKQTRNYCLEVKSSGAYLVTLRLEILRAYLSKGQYNMRILPILDHNQFLFGSKNKRQSRSVSVSRQNRTRMKQIFAYPSRRRYLSHWLKQKNNAPQIIKNNYQAFERFKQNIENRFEKANKFSTMIRCETEDKIYKKTLLKKKRLKNDPLHIYYSKQFSIKKKKIGNTL